MGLTYRTYLEGNSSIFGCSKCKTHLSTPASIISRVSNKDKLHTNVFNYQIAISWSTWTGISI
jgi:hypothetical protein